MQQMNGRTRYLSEAFFFVEQDSAENKTAEIQKKLRNVFKVSLRYSFMSEAFAFTELSAQAASVCRLIEGELKSIHKKWYTKSMIF